jgi:hypothetical protein
LRDLLVVPERRNARASASARPLIFIWQTRVDAALLHCQPLMNCLLFLVGAYTAVQHPPLYLSWLGIPPRLLALSDDWRPLVAKLGIYMGSCVLILEAMDGQKTRRIFLALLFPFLPSVAVMVGVWATRVSTALPMPVKDALWAVVARGSIFGFTAALLISLPMTVLYRVRVTPIAGLILIPVIAHAAAKGFHGTGGSDPSLDLVLQVWAYMSFLISVGILYQAINRLSLTNVGS